MGRYYLLRAYALGVGMGLFVLGLAGFTQLPNLSTTAPENLLHAGVGLLFFCGGLLLADLGMLRSFVGGMGFMLLLGKGTILTTRWVLGEWLSLPVVGIVCLVAGVLSVLLAVLVGSGAATKEEEEEE